MDQLVKLLELFPEVIYYLVYGTVFIYLYSFIATHKFAINSTYRLLPIFVSGVIWKACLDFVLCEFVFHIQRNGLLCLVLSLLVVSGGAVVCSTLIHSQWFNRVLLRIGIHRTTNQCLWDDIFDDEMWVYCHLKNNDLCVLGMLAYFSEAKDKPVVALRYYQFIEKDTGEVTADYSSDEHSMIIIDTNDTDAVELTYTRPRTF